MEKDKLIEIIKKRFGDSDEDLEDLEVVMDALEGIDHADYLEQEMANMKEENEKGLIALREAKEQEYNQLVETNEANLETIKELTNNPLFNRIQSPLIYYII